MAYFDWLFLPGGLTMANAIYVATEDNADVIEIDLLNDYDEEVSE